jgi:hypothetical protein
MLFGIIEQVSDDVTDPYHYPTIRVLVSGIEHRLAISVDFLSAARAQ